VVELGAVGLLLFLSMIGFSLLALARLRRMAIAAKDAYYTFLSTSVSSGIVGFGAAVMFLSAEHAKLFWFAIFLSACMQPLVQQSLNASRAKDKESAAMELSATSAGVSLSAATVSPMPEPAAAKPIPLRVGNWLTRH
jgi:hypothetical protein